MRDTLRAALMGFIAALMPALASAHEVYVLPSDVVQKAIAAPAFSEVNVAFANGNQFLLWAFITAVAIVAIFFISTSRLLERLCDPLLAKLVPYAPAVSRTAVGIAFLSASYRGSVFGPELPLTPVFGMFSGNVSVLLAMIGLMLIVGFYPRVAAFTALGLFCFEVAAHGTYMLTYLNYLGEIAVLFILGLGAHAAGIHHKDRDEHVPRWFIQWKKKLMPLAFPILRVTFGISLIYASLYAKVIHDNLALEVTKRYPDLVHFFGFEPHFLILGAAIVEIVVGMFFVFGIEIRFTSLFLIFWLSLSLWYFGEVVWPHLILIGIPIAFICYGYDKYSLEGYFFKRSRREPVL